MLVGFASSWLAFSGLESISQIAPALREPREQTALRAMLLVMAGILITSPLITAFETALLDVHRVQPRALPVRAGGSVRPGRRCSWPSCFTASTLLMGAANTAIIGCYHVFLALVRLGFMPRLAGRAQPPLQHPSPGHRRSRWWCPIAVIIASQGQTDLLGHMYAFGLLGAFSLTSVGLDRIRWQERKRALSF